MNEVHALWWMSGNACSVWIAVRTVEERGWIRTDSEQRERRALTADAGVQVVIAAGDGTAVGY
jgi:hypothetical protein